MEVGNITKATTFKSFLHLSYKNTQLIFFVTVLSNIFGDIDFWGLHKNMNCAFPLKYKMLDMSTVEHDFFIKKKKNLKLYLKEYTFRSYHL